VNDETIGKSIGKTAGNKHVKRLQANYQRYFQLLGKVASGCPGDDEGI
jgi:hypothetical protein